MIVWMGGDIELRMKDGGTLNYIIVTPCYRMYMEIRISTQRGAIGSSASTRLRV
jgi:hypothetical protein